VLNELARLRPLMQISVEFDEAVVLTGLPLGDRRILTARGGTFDGDRLSGEVMAGGGDWVRHRGDGLSDLDIRLTLRTDQEELIGLTSRGIFNASAEVTQRIRAGESPEPDEYYFRTAMFFETGAAAHQRLNRIVAVGFGTRLPDGMTTEVFEVV
jgi:hypothetical protein